MVTKTMKEREITLVLRAAEKVKTAIEDFKPKVPLFVSLKRKGMRQRHWQRISDEVGFRVEPW
jgi:dynein heavy chain